MNKSTVETDRFSPPFPSNLDLQYVLSVKKTPKSHFLSGCKGFIQFKV